MLDMTQIKNKNNLIILILSIVISLISVLPSCKKDSNVDIKKLPMAEFSANPNSGYDSLTVNFKDESVNNPLEWFWSFGDGAESTKQNPVHTYLIPGTYTVTLKVSNDEGSDINIKSDYITIGVPDDPPEAEFSSIITYGNPPLTVLFADNSKNIPTSWKWDFGDGNSSSLKNPTHTYQNIGIYDVKLIVSNSKGSDSIVKTGFISVDTSTCPCYFIDSRDENIYRIVKIGNQCWMAENLRFLPNVSPANNGSASLPHYYVYNYNGTDVAQAKSSINNRYFIYGVLYNFPAVMNGASSSNSNPSGVQGPCPDGWHVPSDQEWKELEINLGMSSSSSDSTGLRGNNEGSKMAMENAGWFPGALISDDSLGVSGFDLRPAGSRGTNGMFDFEGQWGVWWTCTDSPSQKVWYRSLNRSFTGVYRNESIMEVGYSLRCLRN